MGNQNTRTAAQHRKVVIHTWTELFNHDSDQLLHIISDAWLKSAELTPTWVWALVDLTETQQGCYRQNQQFMGMIVQVRDFLHLLLKVHRGDADMIRTLSFRLGARHRHYMANGKDAAYWHPFAQQLPIAIAAAYMQLHKENQHKNSLNRLLRQQSKDKSDEERVVDAWRQFMNVMVDSIRRGYEGCVSEKTPLRLSLTNTIISMAPSQMRSQRSRSTSHFLDPEYSPSPPSPMLGLPGRQSRSYSIAPTRSYSTATPSPALSVSPIPAGDKSMCTAGCEMVGPAERHQRSRSIFRARPTRRSQELPSIRRLSSPNSHALQLQHAQQHGDMHLLGYRKDSCQRERRSLTLLTTH